MDEQRFDQLSRRLGESRTRRQALRTLGGALIAAVVGTRATHSTIAQSCVNNYGSCQSDGQCCSGAVCEWGMCMPGCRINGAFAHPNSSPAGNSCQVCHPEVSTTSGAPVNEGGPCWSGDPFAGPTICQSGVCAPEGPVSCPPITECHLEGTVNPANGLCTSPPAPAGTPCGIGEMCHGGFYSPGGACDGTGHCLAGGSKTVYCAPHGRCNGTACDTSCLHDDDCADSTVCNGGQCVSAATCTEGAMECEGTGFRSCSDGRWLYRDCAQGTICRELGESIVCDWPK